MMPHPVWVRKHGAFYAGEWVAVRNDETVDHDTSKVALLERLAANGEQDFYCVKVPQRKRP